MRTVRYIPGLDPDLTGATDSTHEMARLRRRACDKALSTMSCQLEADGHDTKRDKRVTLTLIITTAPVDYEYKTGDIALPSVWCGVVLTVVACGALRTVTVSRHSPPPPPAFGDSTAHASTRSPNRGCTGTRNVAAARAARQ